MLKNIGRYTGILAGFGFLLVFVSLVFAQATSENLTTGPKPSAASLEQRKIQALQNFATTTAKEKLQIIEQKAMQTVQNLEKARNEAQTKVLQVREKAQSKIMEIRDEQKRKQAEKIEKQFEHLNKVWTDHFTNLLNKYEATLQKIKNRADKAAANSKDVSSVDELIKKAETAITAARNAVEAQAKKTYTISLTTINSGIAATTTSAGQTQLIKNLREEFKKVKNQLETDLKALRDGVIKDVKLATHEVFEALAKIPQVDKEPTATSTPSQ